jgi:glycerol-3-phosphate acyltransferase PlsY
MIGGFSGALALALAVGYLLGSIPFGLLLTRAAGLGDIRKVGSGNIGATNVLRTGNKGLAALTLALDALKGTLAVLAAPIAAMLVGLATNDPQAAAAGAGASRLGPVAVLALAGGYGAFIGHVYPLWLGFRGGKGVATFIGVLLGLDWRAAALFGAVWLALAVVFRYSSLSALVASIAAPIGIALIGRPELSLPLLPLTLLLFWKHQANIRRLLSGEEPRIGAKA